MSVTLEIGSSLEAMLRRKADLAGVSLESFLLRLAEREVGAELRPDPLLDDIVRRLEQFRGQLGQIPDGAFDPESIYGDQ